MQYGAAPDPDPEVAKDSIRSVTEEMDREIERLDKLQAELEMIGDQLEGTRPREASNPVGPEPAPATSLIESLRRKHRRMQVLISRCEESVSRAHKALG